MPAIQHALFVLIDSLRHDAMADPEGRRLLFPNIARLADRGITAKAVANAQSTQFVLPALFSQTYPLDHGGYNSGIKDRPQSFVESLQQAGFKTYMLATCNQIGMTLGYERGFDCVLTTPDFRTVLQQRIERNIAYEIELWRKGEYDDLGIISVIQREYGALLQAIRDSVNDADKLIWPVSLRGVNAEIAERCSLELALLAASPMSIVRKLETLPPGVCWRYLGQAEVGGIKYYWNRLRDGLSWRVRKAVANQTLWPFLTLAHYPAEVTEVIEPICRIIHDSRAEKSFAYIHLMDVHDCRAINKPLNILKRYRFFPRWLVARLTGKTKRRFLYDGAIMVVDECLGQIVDVLERTGQMDSTVIAITGDHGLHYAASPRGKMHVSRRTHCEDLEIPLILVNGPTRVPGPGMLDSMGVSATFMEALGVPAHESFKGRSLFGAGRPMVVSEHAGAGNADLLRKDLYFTVTSPTHKLMTVLEGSELRPFALFDTMSDPQETKNILSDAGASAIVADLVAHVRIERRDLLAMRGAA